MRNQVQKLIPRRILSSRAQVASEALLFHLFQDHERKNDTETINFQLDFFLFRIELGKEKTSNFEILQLYKENEFNLITLLAGHGRILGLGLAGFRKQVVKEGGRCNFFSASPEFYWVQNVLDFGFYIRKFFLWSQKVVALFCKSGNYQMKFHYICPTIKIGSGFFGASSEFVRALILQSKLR